jgi:hypothetical protein
MKLCKIGSKNTYHKCIKELHQAKYIFYHPATSRYQPVKISMIRLDKTEPKTPEQLNLFSHKIGTHTSTDNEIAHVPNLTDTSPNNDTPPVPNMGHLIKQSNNKQERETLTQQIFKRNKKIQNAVNNMAQVPNSIHIPTLEEVVKYFIEINLPGTEAKKFFSHYKDIVWKIHAKTPIEDCKALIEKWMENAKKWDAKKQPPPASGPLKDIQYLYESYLEGKKIFHHITIQHFVELKLLLNEETLHQALQERISQVSGTNQHSLTELWQGYLTNDPNNQLVQKDRPNVIALAKRIAVINHFQNLKNQSQ